MGLVSLSCQESTVIECTQDRQPLRSEPWGRLHPLRGPLETSPTSELPRNGGFGFVSAPQCTGQNEGGRRMNERVNA